MLTSIIIFISALCSVWKIGEKDGICNYNHKGENNENIHN